MKEERTGQARAAADNCMTGMDRREFFGVAGSGLFVFVGVGRALALQEPERIPTRQGYPTDFNAYLRIGADGRVTCFVGKVELGQGSMTALAQLMAEELDVALDSVDMVMGDTDLCPWDTGTFGSLSIRQFGPVLRAAGAEARAVLVQMASERLQVPAERLRVADGTVEDTTQPAQRVAYAQLVEGRRIERHLAKVPVKSPKAFRVVGRSPARKDALEKVTGRAKYAADLGVPSTLHACILRAPAHGAVFKDVDTAAAERIPGVRLVRDGELIAVLHERPDVASNARGLLKARFDPPPPTIDDRTVFPHLLAKAPAGRTVHERGNLADGEKGSAHVFEESYLNGYVAHAPIETHSAVARIDGGKATVWVGTQTPFAVKNQVAQAIGFAPADVRIVTPFVGGGFGGKSSSRQAIEAARLAKLTGRPVQVVWDRTEEFFFDTFRPAAVVKIRSGLNSSGRINFWDFVVYCAGDRESRQFYEIPNERTVSAGGWGGGNPPGLHPFAIGPWRAPAVNTNTFARESQIDTMAARAGADPVEFRRNHLADPRMKRVLDAAAARFGWKPGKSPSGRGFGVACALYLGTYVATVAEVAVDRKSGRVRVRRVVCAQDMGVTVNPDGARQQIEGCVTMGLGYSLSEEVRFRNGEVLDRNFDTYAIPRFSWLPRIDTVLIENQDDAASGCGEPAIVTMGAVIANAVYDAVGARVRQLPLAPDRILAALR